MTWRHFISFQSVKALYSELKTLAPLSFAISHQCTIGRLAHHAIIGKTCTPCYHWEDMHTMLSLGRHAHHAIIGKTCTPCYHWEDMHTMLSLGRHAHHAIIGKTCTPCYHWEDMLSLGRHAHHAIIGKICTPCYHWEDMHTMLSLGRHAHHAIIGKTCTPCYHNYAFVLIMSLYIISKRYGTVSAKIAPRLKCYENASRLNRHNFPTDNAIDFLFSTLHSEMV